MILLWCHSPIQSIGLVNLLEYVSETALTNKGQDLDNLQAVLFIAYQA